jgi:plasmid stability protein
VAHVQIRNVPPDVHRTLKERAAKKGMSLSEYLLAALTELAERPTLEEHVARVRSRARVRLDVPSAELIREGREERERDLERALGVDDRR